MKDKRFNPEMPLDDFRTALWGKVFIKHLKSEDLDWLLTSKNSRSRIGDDVSELKRDGVTIYGMQYDWDELDRRDKMYALYNLISDLTDNFADMYEVKLY